MTVQFDTKVKKNLPEYEYYKMLEQCKRIRKRHLEWIEYANRKEKNIRLVLEKRIQENKKNLNAEYSEIML